MLVVEQLRYSHAGGGDILEDVSIAVGQGEVLCLLGPNGTGKSTLLKCLFGAYRPQGGSISIKGTNISSISPRHLAREIAYVPQNTNNVFAMTVFDLVLMGRHPHLGLMEVPAKADEEIVVETLEILGIPHLKDRLSVELSGGEKQLVLIARAIAQQSNLLVMDEPTAALDYGNQLRMLALIRELADAGKSIILTTHSPEHAFLIADNVAVMHKGRIEAFGRPRSVMTAELLSSIYQTDIRVVTIPGTAGNRDEEMTICAPVTSPHRRGGGQTVGSPAVAAN